MSTYLIVNAPRPYLVARGKDECSNDHIGTQIIRYDSPSGTHTIWSCPHCHRVVRQDQPDKAGCDWTKPEVVVPDGLGGVSFGSGRAWKMPKVDAPKPWWAKKS